MMLRNKLLTVALAVAAAAVWGGVGLRFFRLARPQSRGSVEAFAPRRDTASVPSDAAARLVLDYPDPFLDCNAEASSPPPPEVEAFSVPGPVELPMMPTLRYKGAVRWRDGKLRALIASGGDVEALAPGAEVEGVRILAVEPAFVRVRWQGEEQILEVE